MTEENFFGPKKPLDGLAIIWKTLAGFLLVGVITAVSFLFSRLQLPDELQEASAVLEKIQNVSDDKVSASGGDVVVAPAAAVEVPMPKLIGDLLPGDDFNAKSIIVKDSETGFVLYKKNEYDQRSIASITKLMSALILLEKNPDWSDMATVVGEDSLDTHMYAGDTYTLDELWYAALVGSSNKAILSLASALDWPMEAFVERMNEKAVELGMSDTVFIESTGLDEGNKSTASDLVILLEEALKQEKMREALLTSEYNLYSAEREKKHHMWNTNWLLLGWIQHDFNKIFGGKTGYTGPAGYSFVVQLSDKNDHIIDVVILGTDEHEARFKEAKKVAEMVFANYEWPVKMQNAE